MRVLNIPNTLTILRIVIIPAFVTAIVYNSYTYAFYLFVIAAITDMLDGMLARLADQKTPLGRFLDPLADKFLLVTSFILFAVYGWIPKWLAITVISRDLIVVIGWLVLSLLSHPVKIEPVILGKTAIALQLITLTYILMGISILTLPPLPRPFLLLTAAVTALSGLQYIVRGFRLTSAT
ncbi:MAG: CDP-alcohol phosphatidyltransferase family protein [Nitrospirae bacterium]|nr:CDP-alcohol phosphatidyltransferase family protein [Nitrospirota bacterium]